MWNDQLWWELGRATSETLGMVLVSSLVAVLLGLPLGILLFVTNDRYFKKSMAIHHLLAWIVNIVRSVPFIILLVAITPLTRWIVGTSIGTVAAMVPLAVSAIPFYARIVESALMEVPDGLKEAAQSMGASAWQIIRKVLLPESYAALVRGATLTVIALVGYSAMAGAIGGGGLGDLAIRYGYQRFEVTVMILTVVVLVLMVQLIQAIGTWLEKHRVSWVGVIVAGLMSLTLGACSDQQKPNDHRVTVGTVSGPETQLMEVAKQVAKKRYGLDVQIVPFSDYNAPNLALVSGSVDANAFQHRAFLEAQKAARHFHIVAIGKTFLYPMGIYSTRVKSLRAVKHDAKVAIPNDPSNEARALLLLQKAKLIRLKPGVGVNALPMDIVNNPKHLQFIELDAAQLPRVLRDVTLAVINTTYAVEASLLPQRDALLHESIHSPYVNLIVVRESDKDRPALHQLVKAFQSPEVKAKAKSLFGGAAIAGW